MPRAGAAGVAAAARAAAGSAAGCVRPPGAPFVVHRRLSDGDGHVAGIPSVTPPGAGKAWFRSGTGAAANYWSSSECAANNAWNQSFDNGDQNNNNKNNTNLVRAVRDPEQAGARPGREVVRAVRLVSAL